MAMIICTGCSKDVSTDEKNCPNCGKKVSPPAAWRTNLIIIIGMLFVVVLALPKPSAIQNQNPIRDVEEEKSKDRQTYEYCLKELESLDRARDFAGARTAAQFCENMRRDFIKKYNVTP